MNPLSTSYGLREGSGEAQVFEKSSFDPVESFKKTEDEIRKAGLAKKEQKDADLASIGDVDVSGMDIDIQRELVGDKKNLISMVQDYYSKGMDPFDSDNEEAFFKVRQAMSGLKNKVAISGNHRDYNAKILTALNSKDADKKYDLEASKKNYNKWRNMSVQDRVGMDPSSILVAKPETFDLLADYKDNVGSIISELKTENKTSYTDPDTGQIVSVSSSEITEDDARKISRNALMDENRYEAARKAYLADPKKGNYNGVEDYYYQNFVEPRVGVETKKGLTALKGGSKWGGTNYSKEQLDQRYRNISSIVNPFGEGSSTDKPTKEAKELLPAMIGSKYNGGYVRDAQYSKDLANRTYLKVLVEKETTIDNKKKIVRDWIDIPLSEEGAFTEVNFLLNGNKVSNSDIDLESLNMYTSENKLPRFGRFVPTEESFSNAYDSSLGVIKGEGLKSKDPIKKEKVEKVELTKGSPL